MANLSDIIKSNPEKTICVIGGTDYDKHKLQIELLKHKFSEKLIIVKLDELDDIEIKQIIDIDEPNVNVIFTPEMKLHEMTVEPYLIERLPMLEEPVTQRDYDEQKKKKFYDHYYKKLKKR